MSRNPKVLSLSRSTDDLARGPMFSFAGRQAQTHDAALLQQAEMAIRSGEDAELVRQQTGWFRGGDGRMRFEISDDQSMPTVQLRIRSRTLSPERELRQMLSDVGARVAYWASLDSRQKRGIDGAKIKARKHVVTALTEVHRVRAELAVAGEPLDNDTNCPLNPKLALALEKREAAWVAEQALYVAHPDVNVKLSDLLQHEELFKAYPQLRELEVIFWRHLQAGDGAYKQSKTKKIIDLSKNSTPEQNHVVLLHEVQHAIQEIEGFASGGSARGMVRYVIDKSRGPLEEEFGHLHSYLMAKEEGRIDEWVLNTISATGKGISPSEAYHRLAGEVEARNVETRMAMTQAQRLATRPEDTSDLPTAETIVKFSGEVCCSEPMNALPQHIGPIIGLEADPCVSEAILEDIVETLSAYPFTPPAGMDGTQVREFLSSRRGAHSALLERLTAQAEGFLLPSIWGGFQAVSADVRPDGQAWRVTAFDADMAPLGHDPFETAQDAVAIVLGGVDMPRLLVQLECLQGKETASAARLERAR